MDKFKEKINQLKVEIDSATARADAGERKLHAAQEQLAAKDVFVNQHQAKIESLEAEIANSESRYNEIKHQTAQNEALQGQTEALARKAQMLETSLHKVNAVLAESAQKLQLLEGRSAAYKEKIERLEQEREEFEPKQQALQQQYVAAKRELDDTLAGLAAL